jgi:Family of unknown function (DUF6335)
MKNESESQLGQLSDEELEAIESEAFASMDLAEIAPEVDAMRLESLDDGLENDSDLAESMNAIEESSVTGGDVDVDPYLAEVVGEEAIGGTTPTPDQNIVDDAATSVGMDMPDQGLVYTNEALEHRDADRWELDPQSSEDYEDGNED